MSQLRNLISKIDRTIADIEDGKIFDIAFSSTMATVIPRIFEDGLKVDGGKIGNYDTKRELWVEDSKLPKAGTSRS